MIVYIEPSFRLVQSRTGTGKTIAFLLPAVHTLLQNPVAADKVGILILSPTRELANQIYDQAVPFAEAMSSQTGAHCAYGGTNVDRKLKEFMYKPSQITIATPGRLLDYMTNPDAVKKFSDLRVLILDEADSMLDMGFMPQVRKILDFLPKKAVAKWQGLLYSATLPAKMDQTAHLVLEPGFTHISTIDKGESQALDKVAQYQYTVSDLRQASYALFDLIFKEMDLKPEGFKCIVFLPTAKQCVLAEEHFHVPGLNKYTLHSRMTQPKRISVTEAFRSCRRGILFATDVVGRGIDFPDVSLVVQSGLPRDAESYVHRLGRTARAGKEGKGVILLTKFEVPFLGTLKNMNLQPYPDTNISERARGEHDRLLRNVHLVSKNKAYQAMLGYYKERSKITGLVGAALVQRINEYALNTLKCEQVPGLHAQTIGKMGLRNVAGVRKISKSEWEAENTKDDEDVRQRNLV